jgi:hypothetical protein
VEAGPLHAAAREPGIVVVRRQGPPALLLLALDVGLGSDVVAASAGDTSINGTAATLTSGDAITAGGGLDVLNSMETALSASIR